VNQARVDSGRSDMPSRWTCRQRVAAHPRICSHRSAVTMWVLSRVASRLRIEVLFNVGQ